MTSMQAAAPVHPHQCDDFLRGLAVELERHSVVGPRLVHRLATDLQRKYVVETRTQTEVAGAPRHLTPRQRPPDDQRAFIGASEALSHS
jgi:hypothetical protein